MQEFSNRIFILRQNVIKLVILILSALLLDNIAEVERIFPEDEHDNHFEDQRDEGNQPHESAQFVLVAAVLFILL